MKLHITFERPFPTMDERTATMKRMVAKAGKEYQRKILKEMRRGPYIIPAGQCLTCGEWLEEKHECDVDDYL